MQPSHHAHPITLSPVAQAIPGKPRFKKQAGEQFRLASTVITVRPVCSPPSFEVFSFCSMLLCICCRFSRFRVIWHSQNTNFTNLLLAGRNTLCFAAVHCMSTKAFRSHAGRRSTKNYISPFLWLLQWAKSTAGANRHEILHLVPLPALHCSHSIQPKP